MFTRWLSSALWIGCAVVLSRTSYAQELATDQPSLKNVAQAMSRYVEAGEVAGVVTLVADKERLLHLDAVGSADLTSGKKIRSDAIFWIASMSKPITGACMMILVDEGKLSLVDPISKYLPEMKGLKLSDGSPAKITIKHLLTHTSGMAELSADEAYTAKTLEEAAQRYKQVSVLFTPGSQWKYSQTSINTAARIIEVVSGMTFDKFLDARLCGPLKMSDTTFYLTEQQLPRLAKSYRKDENGKLTETDIRLLAGKSPTFRERMPAANGGLFSTAADYSRFCRMLLRGGELDGQRVLSAAAVQELRSIHTGELVPGFTPGNGWGIGCCVVRQPQGPTEALSPGSYGHGGAYGTQAWIDPVKQRVYVLMLQRANFANADASDVRRTFQNEANQALSP